jgi:hypothetical protein
MLINTVPDFVLHAKQQTQLLPHGRRGSAQCAADHRRRDAQRSLRHDGFGASVSPSPLYPLSNDIRRDQ